MPHRIRLALCAIMKNEAPYIVEWLAWHRLIGISHFTIFDNDSDDGSGELLRALHNSDLVTYVPFPSPPRPRNPQIAAYRQMLSHHAKGLDWIGFLDADEFLIQTGAQDLHSCLQALPDSVDTMVLNWAIYGSNGARLPDDGYAPSPVLARFPRRAREHFAPNRHVKSFVRVRDGITAHNAHIPGPPRDLTFARPDGSVVDELRDTEGLSHEVSWSRFRVNHYFCKSRAEFLHRKMARGRACGSAHIPEDLFNAHDRNGVFDPVALPDLARLYTEIDRIERCLLEQGLDGWRPRPLPRNLSGTESAKPHFEVSGLTRNGDQICIEGTFVDANGDGDMLRAGLSLSLGSLVAPPLPDQLHRFPRPDIARLTGAQNPYCGFRVLFTCPPGLDDGTVLTVSDPENGTLYSAPLPPHDPDPDRG